MRKNMSNNDVMRMVVDSVLENGDDYVISQLEQGEVRSLVKDTMKNMRHYSGDRVNSKLNDDPSFRTIENRSCDRLESMYSA